MGLYFPTITAGIKQTFFISNCFQQSDIKNVGKKVGEKELFV